jgi:formylglycine-generating enzyme required for sulfatase activity
MPARPLRLLIALAAALSVGASAQAEVAAVRDASAGPSAPPAPAGMVLIPTGSYAPLFVEEGEPARVGVPAFYLDTRPVTNGEFLAFVQANPAWRRSRVSPLFADTGYLGDWAGDLDPGPRAPDTSPVVRVSWFAARANARWVGRRLPTTAEWERAASARFTTPDGDTEPAYRDFVLTWFGTPSPTPLPAAGSGRANFYGVRDLAGLVWEWVSDFNTALVTGDSRGDSGIDRQLFCSGAAAGARDTANYPAFMRAGYRSSLRASYVVPNLGFRCALSIAPSVAAASAVPPLSPSPVLP